MPTTKCPRCYEYSCDPDPALNALSRTTREANDISVYVCSPCGTDEGLREHFDGWTQPSHMWPIASRKYEL